MVVHLRQVVGGLSGDAFQVEVYVQIAEFGGHLLGVCLLSCLLLLAGIDDVERRHIVEQTGQILEESALALLVLLQGKNLLELIKHQ